MHKHTLQQITNGFSKNLNCMLKRVAFAINITVIFIAVNVINNFRYQLGGYEGDCLYIITTYLDVVFVENMPEIFIIMSIVYFSIQTFEIVCNSNICGVTIDLS